MLVMFKIKNFGSFKEETVFDMRAVKSYKEHPYNLTNNQNSDSLLKVACIYGANASGKSTFVSAYDSFRHIVIESFSKNEKSDSETILEQNYYPFVLDNTSFKDDIEFEIVCRIGDYDYKYGFVYNKESIKFEWLYRISLSSNRQSKIFERTSNKIDLGASAKKECDKYIDNIDSSVLVLSFFSSLKLKTSIFKTVVSCITGILPLSFSDDDSSKIMLDIYFGQKYEEANKNNLLSFLNAVDVGIKDIMVEKNNDRTSVMTFHIGEKGKRYILPLELESSGTKRAIALYSFLKIAAVDGKGLIIDELNSQLHPLLQKYLIDLFCKESNYGQLIYTTHDTFLLDKQFVRRDQVWFTSKDDEGKSKLCSLSDFKIRNDKSYRKDYLGGVYGGIPILKDFSFEGDFENGN